jgi:GNAT superfamily N-acetyltransferase
MTEKVAWITDLDSLSICEQRKARQFMHLLWEENQEEFGWIDSSFLTHQTQSRHVWIGHYLGAPISFVIFKTRHKTTSIIQLGVHPELRRLRLGSSLIGHVEEWVKRLKNDLVRVRISSAHPSIKFFDFCGFELEQVQLETRARQTHISVLSKDLKVQESCKRDPSLTARIKTTLDTTPGVWECISAQRG